MTTAPISFIPGFGQGQTTTTTGMQGRVATPQKQELASVFNYKNLDKYDQNSPATYGSGVGERFDSNRYFS